MNPITRYFPELDSRQKDRFHRLPALYAAWNEKINVISRKDIEHIDLHHILHSLAIAKVVRFRPGTRVLDVGTGGGFPGIPLAILFPETEFTLIDSIGKKINVVRAVAESLGMENVTAIHGRAEAVNGTFDFVVSRAVTDMTPFIGWVWDKISPGHENDLTNGILALKGGDLESEMDATRKSYAIFPISDFFCESHFETKSVVYVPR